MADQNEFEEMWEQQRSFMELLREKRGFPEFPVDISSKKGQQLLDNISHHLMKELFEFGQHFKNTKSHRLTEIPEVDRPAALEELCDVQHLLFEIALVAGFTREEFYEAYMQKGQQNVTRINGGY